MSNGTRCSGAPRWSSMSPALTATGRRGRLARRCRRGRRRRPSRRASSSTMPSGEAPRPALPCAAAASRCGRRPRRRRDAFLGARAAVCAQRSPCDCVLSQPCGDSRRHTSSRQPSVVLKSLREACVGESPRCGRAPVLCLCCWAELRATAFCGPQQSHTWINAQTTRGGVNAGDCRASLQRKHQHSRAPQPPEATLPPAAKWARRPAASRL